jgi:phosphoserine phosphatase
MIGNIICFDCDSTLSQIEGIDELAKKAGLGEEMAALTNSAMNGEVPLEAVYERRLSLIKPDQDAVSWLADLYIETIVEDAEDVINALMEKDHQVHIISGGLRQAILPLAKKLGLPENHTHAVDVFFDHEGRYQGFDTESPLAKTGGKAKICQSLQNGTSKLIMIGDGQTDVESKQAGAMFIGFGGVVERKAVREQADYYVSTSSLAGVLEHIIE